jgi:glycosyltransferase involved in cell wall biosynthesis
VNATLRGMNGIPDVSVVLPTYNRAANLRRALASVLDQRTSSRRYEVIVVDNNSSDDTRAEVDRAIAEGAPVRYVLERNQGVSYARNAGIAAARAPLVAFVDDDVCVDADWIETICRTFEQHPELDCVGGKVLPKWEGPPPAWLTRDHWAPLALLDFGETSRSINAGNQLCLLTANFACRRETLDRVGLFRTELQRVRDGIGSMEDHEWQMRFWAAGRQAMYVSELRAVTDVPLQRMTRAYHRRWHSGHGHYFALVREAEFEASKTGRLFDIPAHAYRAAIRDAACWLARLCRGDVAGAFLFETRLRFFGGYFRTRVTDYFRRLRPAEPSAVVLPDRSDRPGGNSRVAPL